MLEVYFSNTLLGAVGGTGRSYSREILSYSNTKSANGGYDSANISLLIKYKDMMELAQWLVGKEVFSYIGTELIWAGIVNEVSLTIGQESITLGPYLNMSNKVTVRYTDYTTGVPNVTTYANDTYSQSKYGTLVKILNGSSISATNANKIRDRYLIENSNPKINKSVGLGSNQSFNISCLGHYHLLETYIYNSTDTGVESIDTKIREVLESQPNSIFSTDYDLVEPNTLSVLRTENTDRTAIDIIKELVALGDDNTNNRTFFGIKYRKPYYKTIQYLTTYYLDLTSKTGLLTNANNYDINPWSIEPGNFVELIGDISYDSKVYNNTRVSLIDSVTYTFPYQYQIVSGDSGTLSQQLAKLGISGL